jgi:hypothetical protein
MKQSGLIVAALTVFGVFLSSCATNSTPTPVLLLTLPPIGTAAPNPTSDVSAPTVAGPELQQNPTLQEASPLPAGDSGIAVQAAVSLLADELAIESANIALVGVLPTEWPDPSLGCPEPDQVYPQVITPGFIVTLTANGANYEVHTDASGTALFCKDVADTSGGEGVTDPIVDEFVAEGKRELSEQFRVPEDQIALVRSEAVDWSDSSLGCAQAGQSYLAVITPGYRIILAVGEQWYEFHTDQQRMIQCSQPTE